MEQAFFIYRRSAFFTLFSFCKYVKKLSKPKSNKFLQADAFINLKNAVGTLLFV